MKIFGGRSNDLRKHISRFSRNVNSPPPSSPQCKQGSSRERNPSRFSRMVANMRREGLVSIRRLRYHVCEGSLQLPAFGSSRHQSSAHWILSLQRRLEPCRQCLEPLSLPCRVIISDVTVNISLRWYLTVIADDRRRVGAAFLLLGGLAKTPSTISQLYATSSHALHLGFSASATSSVCL